MDKNQNEKNIGMMQIPLEEMDSFRKGMFTDYVEELKEKTGLKEVDIPFESYFENGGREEDCLNIPYYFIDRSNNSKVGFALIAEPYSGPNDMILWQFYIDEKLRETGVKGLGTECARVLLSRHPGVTVLKFYNKNTAAKNFWAKVAREFGIGIPDKDGNKHRWSPSEPSDPSTWYQFTIQSGINGIASDKRTFMLGNKQHLKGDGLSVN